MSNVLRGCIIIFKRKKVDKLRTYEITGGTQMNNFNVNLGICTTLVEPEVNNLASNYIEKNYEKLANFTRAIGIREKCYDLLNDVFISIREAEKEGEGYQMMSYNNNDSDFITVEQFVKGRIKGYSKNVRYRADIVENASSNVYGSKKIEIETIDEYGNVVKNYRTIREKTRVLNSSFASSFNEGEDELDNSDGYQKAYAMAAEKDDLTEIEEMHSLRENIDFCIDICNLYDVNIVNIFKNIDDLAEMLGNSGKKSSYDGIFDNLTRLVKYHDELGQSIRDVIMFSMKNKEQFEKTICRY